MRATCNQELKGEKKVGSIFMIEEALAIGKDEI